MINQIPNPSPIEGILLIDKSKGPTSFRLVHMLRKKLGVKKIGHAGTLDPFATGVMVMLIGRRYTRLSDQFLSSDKEYLAEVYLGKTTDTFDSEGVLISQSSIVPSREDIDRAISFFQGEIEQIPPMFSAKKVAGKKLYEFARQGLEIERKAAKVQLNTEIIRYEYPYLDLKIICSKGTYIRSIAYDLGKILGCGAHLSNLQRTRSGQFHLKDCIQEEEIQSSTVNLCQKLICVENLFLVSNSKPF